MNENNIIIAYHLRPRMRFWDEFYGRVLTVISNEHDPENNRNVIRVRELPHTLSVDAMEFVSLRP